MTKTSPQSREWIERLIAFPTVSRDSNLDLIHCIRDYLAELGIDSRLVHDESGRKANLYATIGPQDRPGVMLSGHTDVVPVDGQDWTSDPFKVVEREGKLFGRGTSDMKSFIAIVLAALPRFAGRKLKTPIHLAFSYDEEVGCLGVRRLIAQFDAMPIRPAFCIVGEPTSMQVVRGHKGKLSCRCHVRGLESHSALNHLGVNAVEIAAEMIAYLRRMGRRIRAEGPFDDGFDPPYTTVHTGVVHGGTQLNIVPRDCRFDFEFRPLPSHDPRPLLAELKAFAERELLPEMKAVTAQADIRWEPLSEFSALDTDEDAEVTRFVKSLTGSNSTGKVAFGTEAGLFSQAHIPTVVCGPGSIEQAHKPDEWITLEQIARCEAFMGRLLERVSQDGI
ncbi:MAG TPA: acetylornithine deacetylase [Alphaproteobacteria bacterium]|nr:acetylornithine deacetylase [Alphaproteobacteria bacterium]